MSVADPKVLAERFVDFARFILTERERGGKIAGISSEWNRFTTHMEHAPFAQKALAEISRRDIEAWVQELAQKTVIGPGGVEGRKLKGGTIKRCLSLCSAIFAAAGADGYALIENNPFSGLKIDRLLRADDDDEDDEGTYLTLAEQQLIERSVEVDEPHRLTILFAIGTGLSQGEQFQLRLEDLRLLDEQPHVLVRFGSGGRQLRAEESRKAFLLGPSLNAARRWQELLPEYAPQNPLGLLFPYFTGSVRSIGKPLGRGGRLREILKEIGITRRVRWMDLRHTCAVSMASGFWGPRYDIPDIARMLGVTQSNALRYVEFVKSKLGQNPEEETLAGSALAPAREVAARVSADVIETALLRVGRAELPQLDEPPMPSAGVATAIPSRWDASRVELDEEAVLAHARRLSLRPAVLARAAAALSTGKHLLLIGPPGTGKTELAHALVDAATAAGYCRGAHVATASADWTTFDTIGGYAVEKSGRLKFRPGALLRAIEAHSWLVIDELNRADVDRAFGEFMTVLSGRTTDTSYELEAGNVVRIGSAADASHRVGPTFRVIATMNTWDKTSLFRLSYAVQRRFALVQVGVPTDEAFADLVVAHAEGHTDAPLDRVAVERITGLFSSRGLLDVRPIGPAIALDLVRYVRRRILDPSISAGDALAEAIEMFVLPQLEGLAQVEASDAFRAISRCLSGFATAAAVQELRARFEESLPHAKLPTDGR